MKAETVVRHRYAGDENLGSELYSIPPASSLPIVTAKQNAWISKYNSLYFYSLLQYLKRGGCITQPPLLLLVIVFTCLSTDDA